MTNTHTPQNKYLTVNGLTLHYLDWGGDSPNVVLLVPGIGGNAHNWTPFARRIYKDYRVLVLEQRGHGDSEHSREGYAATSFASDLHGFISALKIAPVDYVASSLGARTAGICRRGPARPGPAAPGGVRKNRARLPEKLANAMDGRLRLTDSLS